MSCWPSRTPRATSSHAPARLVATLALAAVVALATACASAPGRQASRGPPVPPVPRGEPLVDIEHYTVDVDIDHRAGFVYGTVAVRFRALPDRPADALRLDAVEMEIIDVSDQHGNELEHAQRDHRLDIRLAEPVPPGEQAEVSVTYACYPRRGLYVIPPSAQDPEAPWQLWTQGETHETRFWVPCWDQPDELATLTLHATVDGAFMTLGPGQLTSSVVNERTGRRTDTWELHTPHVSYLMTLVAGQLAVGEIPGGPVPLPVVAQADALPRALENFADTPAILRQLEEFTGRPYPYPKYAQSCVKEFVAGGQENISATTLLHETIHDPADEPQVTSVDLIAHEAAHQWFGDLLTCRDWEHLWLNEGFATWCEAHCVGRLSGQDRLRATWLGMQRDYVEEAQRRSHPIMWRDWSDPDDVFDAHAYEGAGARLRLLEELLGPDAFRDAVQHYVRQREGSPVTTADFRQDVEEATGRDLSQFFDEWFLGAGFPELRARPVRTGRDAPLDDPTQGDTLLVEQVQRERGWRDVFHFPVTVTWSRGGLEKELRVDVDERVERVPLEGAGALNWVRLDGTTVLPGTIEMQQGEGMWSSQLRGASDGVTRLVAAEWFLAGPPAPHDSHDEDAEPWQPAARSVSQLVEAAQLDPFEDVRAMALLALASVSDARIPPLMEALLRDPHARVREAAAAGLAEQGGGEVLAALMAAARDPNASVQAAALDALVQREFPGAFRLCAEVARETDKYRLDAAIVRIAARIADDPDVEPFLLAAAQREPVPRVRAAAVQELSMRQDPRGVFFRALGDLLSDHSYIVRAAAADGLARLDAGRARALLAARREIEIAPEVLRAIDRGLAPPAE